jgi:ABC-type Na+ efflux pump permease subunit
MNRIDKIIVASLLAIIVPVAFVTGQDKKSEQRIKIVVSDDGGTKTVIDTLITGDAARDSLVLKDGKTIYLTQSENNGSDAYGGAKQYVVTTTVTDGNDTKKEVTKEIRIISSDSDMQTDPGNGKGKQARCEEMVNGGKYSYTIVSSDKEPGSDMAKYVISKDGLRITVEGSDYDKVKEVIKNIEKSLDDSAQKK